MTDISSSLPGVLTAAGEVPGSSEMIPFTSAGRDQLPVALPHPHDPVQLLPEGFPCYLSDAAGAPLPAAETVVQVLCVRGGPTH